MNELTVREYLGNRIEFKMVDGHVYANANQMANGFGGSQKLKDWKRSENTKRYIEALEAKGKFSTPLIDTKIGGINGGETWIHEKLVLNFARYLNVEFELWCDEQIATLLREGKVELQPTNDKISLLMRIVTANGETELALAMNRYENNYVKPLELDNKIKSQQIAELQPKGTYYDLVLQCKNLLSVGQIAKDYGKSPQWLNDKLHELKVQYKQGNVWLLYQKYADKGYTKSKTQPITRSTGPDVVLHTYWTQKGRLFIYELLKSQGILPNVEIEEVA